MSDNMNDWEHFTLQYDPNPSGRYRDTGQGYWAAKTDLGYIGDGPTPEAALAALVIEMSKALRDAE